MKFLSASNRYLSCMTIAALLAVQSQKGFASVDVNAAKGSDDLTHLSLEELGNLVVTSVSKKPELLREAASSIFVITRDDIRRSGATILPDALRLAPNLQVAEVGSSRYAISARGFNGLSANKLLVLIDGRTVYSPLFSGVFWDVQDVLLEDIERIEVISGPGGTLWGVNAVDGVINVITRSSKDTQGGLFSAGGGNHGNDVSVRYGGEIGTGGAYRLYAKTSDFNHTVTAADQPIDDGWHLNQVGFRTDWTQADDHFTLQGDAYRGTEAQPAPGEIQLAGTAVPFGQILISGENLNGNWRHRLDGGSDLSVQAYLDRTERIVTPTFADTQKIFDLQVLQSLQPIGAHVINWGAEYRYGIDNVVSSRYIAFLPARLNQSWTSLFAQDQWALRDDLLLTAGARVERNNYTGNEFLPDLRLTWKLGPNNMFWSALSRTVRAPSRLDHDIFAPGTPPYKLAGGPNDLSEVGKVLEIGYRGQASPNFSYSVTVFHVIYDHLKSAAFAPSGTNVIFNNGAEGTASGLEFWGNYHVSDRWRLSAGLTGLKENVQFYPNSGLQFPQVTASDDPAETWMLRSSHDLPGKTELDLTLRHVAALSSPEVPAYTVLDGRLGWMPKKNLELSLTVQNAIGSGHGEFSNVAYRTEVLRSAYIKLVDRF